MNAVSSDQAGTTTGARAALASSRSGWRGAFLLALAWVIADGFWLDQGVPSVLLLAFLTLVWLPFNLLALRHRGHRRQRLARYALYAAAALLAIGIKVANAQLAQARAEELIAAAQAWHAAQGAWPERLEQLVPGYLPAIPRAKYVLSDFGFRYTATPAQHQLAYVAMPPFGRRIYTFESGQWSTLD